jgi:hypothetical protein
MLWTGAFTSIVLPVAKISSLTGSLMLTWFPEYVTSAAALKGMTRRVSRTIIRNFFIISPKSRLSGARYKMRDSSKTD